MWTRQSKNLRLYLLKLVPQFPVRALLNLLGFWASFLLLWVLGPKELWYFSRVKSVIVHNAKTATLENLTTWTLLCCSDLVNTELPPEMGEVVVVGGGAVGGNLRLMPHCHHQTDSAFW